MTVLVLRALGIGDFATAVPAPRALRAAFPREPVLLAAPRWPHPLVHTAITVCEVLDAVDEALRPADEARGPPTAATGAQGPAAIRWGR